MSIIERIDKKIKRMKPGEIIRSKDFSFIKNSSVVTMYLSRYVKKGVIKRLVKGVYYKPKISKWGEILPTENDVLKMIIKKEKFGLVSGMNVLNGLGLTTQVPSTIEIKGKVASHTRSYGHIKVKFIKSSEAFKLADQPYIHILDALKLIKNVPDSNVKISYKTLKFRIDKMNEKEVIRLTEISLNKKPVVRALLGSMIEDRFKLLAEKIKATLNNSTKYYLGLDEKTVPNRAKWKLQ